MEDPKKSLQRRTPVKFLECFVAIISEPRRKGGVGLNGTQRGSRCVWPRQQVLIPDCRPFKQRKKKM
ncbi:hypothetical protein E2C01_017527 [Portunus trituberculatus]|uniref:Uncharacterized protein n=1 Tax=Portunus trituberculatus TaxID=210409 RepID=A0A5B7DU23_PORTR|nr:hypothetical protein [Portunus trituberculatus]